MQNQSIHDNLLSAAFDRVRRGASGSYQRRSSAAADAVDNTHRHFALRRRHQTRWKLRFQVSRQTTQFDWHQKPPELLIREQIAFINPTRGIWKTI